MTTYSQSSKAAAHSRNCCSLLDYKAPFCRVYCLLCGAPHPPLGPYVSVLCCQRVAKAPVVTLLVFNSGAVKHVLQSHICRQNCNTKLILKDAIKTTSLCSSQNTPSMTELLVISLCMLQLLQGFPCMAVHLLLYPLRLPWCNNCLSPPSSLLLPATARSNDCRA